MSNQTAPNQASSILSSLLTRKSGSSADEIAALAAEPPSYDPPTEEDSSSSAHRSWARYLATVLKTRSLKLSTNGRHAAYAYLAGVIGPDIAWERFEAAPPSLRLAHAELRSLYGVGARDPNELEKAARVLQALDPASLPRHLRYRPLVVLSQTLSALSRLDPKQQPQEATWLDLKRQIQASLDEHLTHKPARAALQEALDVVKGHCAFAAGVHIVKGAKGAYSAKLQRLLELFVGQLVRCGERSYRAVGEYWHTHVGDPLRAEAAALGIIPLGEAPLERADRVVLMPIQAYAYGNREGCRGLSYELIDGLSFEAEWSDHGQNLWVKVSGLARPERFFSTDPTLTRGKDYVSFCVFREQATQGEPQKYLFKDCLMAAPAKEADVETLHEETFELQWPDQGEPSVVLNALKKGLPVGDELIAEDDITLSLEPVDEGIKMTLEYYGAHRLIVAVTGSAGAAEVGLERPSDNHYQGVLPFTEGQTATVTIKLVRAA